ncbi:DUF1801 domain-containing protein [uncultured Shimia sp.]|uniref:DUF1801 domain-containing protein n=1 Tax=uncultured Shimia sp. TaxID=573152 RepID=UPI00262A16FC|nr:DUF1801 domain-containing protein [uncultured Shimia sp.]
MSLPALSDPIQNVVETWPELAQTRFYTLRQIIHDTAATNPDVAPLTEDLKWGEPSFLTKTGTTLRIDWKPKHAEEIGLFVICRTDLLEQVRNLYPDTFRYEGTRALYLPLGQPIPEEAIAYLSNRTQTYKL